MPDEKTAAADDAASPNGDLTQIGGSPASAATLDRLEELGFIQQRMHGYRLAVAVAIGLDLEPRPGPPAVARTTMYALSGLDEDSALRSTIREIYPQTREMPGRALEDLAEQGFEVIANSFDGDNLSFTELFRRVEEANGVEAEQPEIDTESLESSASPA